MYSYTWSMAEFVSATFLSSFCPFINSFTAFSDSEDTELAIVITPEIGTKINIKANIAFAIPTPAPHQRNFGFLLYVVGCLSTVTIALDELLLLSCVTVTFSSITGCLTIVLGSFGRRFFEHNLIISVINPAIILISNTIKRHTNTVIITDNVPIISKAARKTHDTMSYNA